MLSLNVARSPPHVVALSSRGPTDVSPSILRGAVRARRARQSWHLAPAPDAKPHCHQHQRQSKLEAGLRRGGPGHHGEARPRRHGLRGVRRPWHAVRAADVARPVRRRGGDAGSGSSARRRRTRVPRRSRRPPTLTQRSPARRRGPAAPSRAARRRAPRRRSEPAHPHCRGYGCPSMAAASSALSRHGRRRRRRRRRGRGNWRGADRRRDGDDRRVGPGGRLGLDGVIAPGQTPDLHLPDPRGNRVDGARPGAVHRLHGRVGLLGLLGLLGARAVEEASHLELRRCPVPSD